jgi:hypothetical protein
MHLELLQSYLRSAPIYFILCFSCNGWKRQTGLIRHLNSEESADTFVPILIYVVLKASPENLLSNVEYVYSPGTGST